MSAVRAAASRFIGCPPERAYRCLADYAGCHSRILPPAFDGLTVEEGGVGAGTVFSSALTVLGRRRAFRAQVSEPEPGRVLVETIPVTFTITTFTVDPAPGGCRVTIETMFPQRPGIGWIEQLLAPRLLRGIFAGELARLEQHVRQHGEGAG